MELDRPPTYTTRLRLSFRRLFPVFAVLWLIVAAGAGFATGEVGIFILLFCVFGLSLLFGYVGYRWLLRQSLDD